jgi:hypothetical protein
MKGFPSWRLEGVDMLAHAHVICLADRLFFVWGMNRFEC